MITADLKSPTPIQRTIAERRRAFHAAIAARAAALQEQKAMMAQGLQPQSFPAEPDPPVRPEAIADVWPASHADSITPDDERPQHITMDNIARNVCAYFGVTKAAMDSTRRPRVLVRARQVGQYLARQFTEQSWPAIARRFGGRDHTTALYGARQVSKQLLTDADLAHDVALLIERITGGRS